MGRQDLQKNATLEFIVRNSLKVMAAVMWTDTALSSLAVLLLALGPQCTRLRLDRTPKCSLRKDDLGKVVPEKLRHLKG